MVANPPKLPSIGLGTASLALLPERECEETLDYALEAGIVYFDTAPLYGGGQAETRLGGALNRSGCPVMVSTKCGRLRDFAAAEPRVTGIEDRVDYSAEGVRRSIMVSSDRLGRQYLDVVFLHDIELDPDRAFGEALPALRELQSQGWIGSVGAGCNSIAGLLAALRAGAADVLLIAGRWTIMDRSAGNDVLPLAEKAGTQVVAGALLNSGGLAAPSDPVATFDYRPMTPTMRRKAQALGDRAKSFGGSVLAAALQFPTRDRRVGTALLGAAGREQLAESLKAINRPMAERFWSTLDLEPGASP